MNRLEYPRTDMVSVISDLVKNPTLVNHLVHGIGQVWRKRVAGFSEWLNEVPLPNTEKSFSGIGWNQAVETVKEHLAYKSESETYERITFDSHGNIEGYAYVPNTRAPGDQRARQENEIEWVTYPGPEGGLGSRGKLFTYKGKQYPCRRSDELGRRGADGNDIYEVAEDTAEV